jgi:hypothetical protein
MGLPCLGQRDRDRDDDRGSKKRATVHVLKIASLAAHVHSQPVALAIRANLEFERGQRGLAPQTRFDLTLEFPG